MFKEAPARSIVKTVTYRVAGSAVTALFVFMLGGPSTLALAVGGLDAVSKVVIYFAHERLWDKIKFGRRQIRPCVVWLTGLSGSGKTSIAKEVVKRLEAQKIRVEHLDGETIRQLFPRTGFTRREVNDHIERVGYLASKLEKNGVFVVASFISPHFESREFVRMLCKNFMLIHISTPLEVCQQRDPSHIYERRRSGAVQSVAGIDVSYEIPRDAQLTIDASTGSVETAADAILKALEPYL